MDVGSGPVGVLVGGGEVAVAVGVAVGSWTMIWPVIPEPQWRVQKYGYVPAVSKVKLKLKGVSWTPLSHFPSGVQGFPLVVEWPDAAHSQVTVSPTSIVKDDGLKVFEKPGATVTVNVVADAGRAKTAASAARRTARRSDIETEFIVPAFPAPVDPVRFS